MYKITFVTDPQFKINKDKNTVACYAKVKITGLDEHFALKTKGCAFNDDNVNLETFVIGDLYTQGIIPYNTTRPFFISEQATCSDMDFFREDLGKHIAETKLRIKLYKIMDKINCSVLKYINQLDSKRSDAVIKTNFLLDRERKHLKELINETY